MTVHVARRRPRPHDVVVTATGAPTAADLRRALSEHLGAPATCLVVSGRAVPDDASVGRPPLLDGVSVVLADGGAVPAAGGAGDHPRPVLLLATVAGPDAGRSVPVAPPGVDVGRGPTAGLRIDDDSLSRVHARVDVGPGGVTVRDLGSTNGVVVDGHPVQGRTTIDTSSVLTLGATGLRLRRAPGPGAPVDHPGDGTAVVAPAPGARPPARAVRVHAPATPAERPPSRVPWVAALAPVPVVALLAVFLGPQVLVFAVVGPLALLASSLAERLASRRRARRDDAAHRAALATARARFAEALETERTVRHLEQPDPDEVLRRAEHRLPGLWGGIDLVVRLGLGAVASGTEWVTGDGHPEPAVLEGVPVTVDLGTVGCLGVVADAGTAERVVAAVVGRLLVSAPPSELSLHTPAVPASTSQVATAGRRHWSDWVPHHGSAGRPLLVTAGPLRTDGGAAEVRRVLDREGIVVLSAERRDDLPDGCGAVVEAVGGGRWLLTVDGVTRPFVADGVGEAWRERLGRALTPLREGGDHETLPTSVDLGTVTPHPLDPHAIRTRWARSAGPRATVGRTVGGPFVIDLAADGPHVLVGGTTGSGKSEFLRTLVTALALESPPRDLTLLLVDFKGGAAFGPCSRLPHVVGVVSDLDEHLVDRVLRSLGAELRRREHLLAEVGAGDLDEYRTRPAAEGLPRLVVVVDEVRALVDSFPDAMDRLVRLAAQGRSLGMHLVLATQRPAGTLSAEVQANVDLRIAFRVRDRADSVGVVEDDSAAALPADLPGRAVARGGDGSLTPFQAALVRPPAAAGPCLRVRPAAPASATSPSPADSDRARETAAVVELVAAAHAGDDGDPPRCPWLPPLPSRVDVGSGPPGTVAVVDDPDHQRRQAVTWAPGTTSWRVVGPSGSGRSGTARAVVRAAVSTALGPPVHVHVLGARGEHDDLRGLPQVGTVAALDDQEAVRALLEHLADRPDDGTTTVLVVDGWERLTDHDDPRDVRPTSDALLRLLSEGAGAGLVGVVTGGRELLRPAWSGLGGETVLLGAGDPLDAALVGLPSSARLRAAGPGRGVRVADGLEIQVVDATGRVGTPAWPVTEGRADTTAPPWRYLPLPTVAHRHASPAAADVEAVGLLVGLAAPDARPWGWSPEAHGRRLLVAGPPGSGRSATLGSLAVAASRRGLPVVQVGDPAPVRAGHAVPPACRLLGPRDVDDLVTLRRRHPDLLVLVDDADRLDDAPVRPVLDEIVDLADRDGGAVAVASTTTGLRGRFRGLDVDVARHGLGLLLRPEPTDGEAIGAGRLPRPSVDAPGRGVVVLRGRVTPVQVFAPDPRPELVPQA